jgi:hypothetical protein
VYPQLLHFGKFYLPTYGFLVSTGVLLGLWVSVRNSERLGIDGEKAWNFGILVVLAPKFSTSSTSGAITRRIPERSSASPHCRPEEFFPVACWRRLS